MWCKYRELNKNYLNIFTVIEHVQYFYVRNEWHSNYYCLFNRDRDIISWRLLKRGWILNEWGIGDKDPKSSWCRIIDFNINLNLDYVE